MPEILLLTILFGSYLLPWIVATVRHHPSRGAICVVNLFFGWTVVGWFASLAWAVLGGDEGSR